MIQKGIITKIKNIWDDYISSEKKVCDTKGKELSEIDKFREEGIIHIRELVDSFMSGNIDISSFKTRIDSFNKRNNYWGFTATKGQMFFNQLVKTDNIDEVISLLKETIVIPSNLKEALNKIEKLEKYCLSIYSKAKDRRKVANPGSVGYFLSYFWQIYDSKKWPILYTSQLMAYRELDLLGDYEKQKDIYENFYNKNEEVKRLISQYSNKEVYNWDVEHAFWNYKGNPNKTVIKKDAVVFVPVIKEEISLAKAANFNLTDYLIPKVANLISLGECRDLSASAKGSAYEKLVSEIFRQLDFEVEELGQGKGRTPDAIIRFREDNTAFLVDAKAYSNGYNLGVDDRAMREYISHYTPSLIKEGYKKIGFIIVSNSFTSSLDSFVNDITWNTDIKRFVLLRSEALLYLLAYKTKDRLGLSQIVESMIGFGNPISAQQVIEEFEDI